MGSHVTITHDALDLTVQGPSSAPPVPPDMGPTPVLPPFATVLLTSGVDLLKLVHLRT